MKTLVLSLILCLPVSAFAKTTVLTGAKARSMMESLAAAGFEVTNLDSEWSSLKQPLSIRTGAFYCHFDAQYPDEWMVSARCDKGAPGSGAAREDLPNPLSLAQAIKPYAPEDDGLGNRWIWVDDVTCELAYSKHAYRCKILVK